MNDRQICSRNGCGKEINPQEYVSKKDKQFCSYKCADWGNKPAGHSQDTPHANITDWQTLPAPSS